MIVYGDPSSQESLRALVARLRESLLSPGAVLPEERRRALILAGTLEQAVEDGLPEWGAPCRALTDALAEAFLRAEPSASAVDGALAALAQAPDASLTMKTPEGFAFYGLYPEAYAVAVQRWQVDHPGAQVAVIGVRSIGTTLSAVVLAALRARRSKAFRLTVRPFGHPFAREAVLPSLDADWALIVDEGPGLSGSSMAAVAAAAMRAGIARDRIVFFPGHSGEPGAQASEGVRALWRGTPRVAVRAEELRWEGHSLEETLLRRTEGGTRLEELSEGRWRAAVYDEPADWPGVALPFERRKLRIVRADGSAVRWKFVGLTVPGTVLGFAPASWIEGEPLRRSDATPETVARIGRHVAAVAGPPLTSEAARAARARLEAMLRANAAEAGLDSHFSPPQAQGGSVGGRLSARTLGVATAARREHREGGTDRADPRPHRGRTPAPRLGRGGGDGRVGPRRSRGLAAGGRPALLPGGLRGVPHGAVRHVRWTGRGGRAS